MAVVRPLLRSAARWRAHAPMDFAPSGDAMLVLDCHPYMNSWFGVVKIREPERTRIVHVCSALRASARVALDDARREAQHIAALFAQ